MAFRFSLLALLIAAQPAAAIVSLQATGGTAAAPGGTADLCVTLSSGGEQIAGTQNDLVWDGSCATLRTASDCRIGPVPGKQLFGGFAPNFDFTFRALVLSLSDVEPISDGVLYCCTFTVDAPPGQCCNVDVVRAGASDPKGVAIGIDASTGAHLCVADDGLVPTPTATPGDPPIAGDGCEMEPTGSALPALSMGLALLWLWRRSSSLKRPPMDETPHGYHPGACRDVASRRRSAPPAGTEAGATRHWLRLSSARRARGLRFRRRGR